MALILARGFCGARAVRGRVAARDWPAAGLRPGSVGSRRRRDVTVLGVGFDLAPTCIYHWLRWQATGVYVVYAIASDHLFRRQPN